MLSFVCPPPAFLSLGRADLCSRRRSRRATQFFARLVSLPTGIDMEVVQHPECTRPNDSSASYAATSQKPPLIFIHGTLHAAWCYYLFQTFFANHGFQTYAVSLRGSAGTNAGEVKSVAVSEHITDLNALLSKLQLSAPPLIVAHSSGGFIAQKWIELDETLNIRGLVLMASSPPSGNTRMVWRTVFRDGLWRSLRITLGLVRRSVANDLHLCREIFFSDKNLERFSEELEGDEKLREYMDLFKLTGPGLDPNDLKSVVKGTGRLSGNVLVIGGLLDALVDRKALEETAEHWTACLRLLDDAPHDLMLYSNWKSVALLMLEWINSDMLCLESATGVSRTQGTA